MKLSVIGAGAWGTTLAALASEHVPTTIWAREPAVVNAIRDRHENVPFLPGFTLPPELCVTIDLAAAVADADVVVVAVPSPYVRRGARRRLRIDRPARPGGQRDQGPRSRDRQADDRGDRRHAGRPRPRRDRRARRSQPGP